MNNSENFDWAVCIIASREDSTTVMSTLNATLIASLPKHSIIDLVINGNLNLANEIEKVLKLQDDCHSQLTKVRLWFIEESDKANAWNQYLLTMWPGAELTFFVDGYARPWSDAFLKIDAKLKGNPRALAASAVPTDGNSANYLRKTMISEGGIHGNLFAIKHSTIITMRNIDFKLPIGIYRTDSTIAAAMAFNLDPERNVWNVKERILVVSEASWSLSEKKDRVLSEILGYIKRKVRQARGRIENLAVKEHFAILKKSPSDLPRDVNLLISGWLVNNKKKAFVFFITHPLSFYALLQPKSDYSEIVMLPKCLAEGYCKDEKI